MAQKTITPLTRPRRLETDILTVAEVAAQLGISRSTLYNIWARGDGPTRFYLLPETQEHPRVRQYAVNDWLARQEAIGA